MGFGFIKKISWRRIPRMMIQYLLSYAVILLIPLFAFNFLITYRFIPHYQKEVVNATYNNLNRIKDQFESMLDEMMYIALSISENPRLTPYMIRQNSYKASEGIYELRNYKHANDYFLDILYYVHNDDRIYGANQSANINFMFSRIYRFAGGKNTLIQEINEVTVPTVKPINSLYEYNGTQEKSVICYLYPITPFAPYATVTFILDNAKISEMFGNIFTNYSENLYVFGADGTVVTLRDTEKKLSPQDEKLIFEKTVDEKNFLTQIQDKKLNVIGITSEKNGWSYVSVVNSRAFMAQADEIRSQINIIIILAFMMGAVAIALFYYWNYTPIYKLYKRVRNISGLDSNSEIQAVNIALNEVISKNQALLKDYEYYKPMLRRFLFNELLSGEISSNTIKIIHESNIMDIKADKNHYYLVFLCRLDINSDVLNAYRMLEQVSQILIKTFEGGIYICDPYKKNTTMLTCICFFDYGASDEIETDLNKTLSIAAARLEGFQPSFGVGGLCDDILSLNRSFLEALKALRHNNGEDRINFYARQRDSCETENRTSFYPYLDLVRLSAKIRSGNYQHVRGVLDKLFLLMRSNDVPVFIRQCIIFDLYNMLLKTALVMNVDFFSAANCTIEDLSMFDFSDTGALEFQINNMVRRICGVVSKKVMEDDNLTKTIGGYVLAHFSEYSFSIEKVADEAGLSVPYMSKLFKDKTGFTVAEYLWKARLDHAKHLLRYTDENLESIVNKIGYVDVSSFIKKFKKSEGVTPGEFRK